MSITCGFAESPFGRCLVDESQRGVCHLAFVEPDDGQAELAGLRENWPRAGLQHDDVAASRLASEPFSRPEPPCTRRTLRVFVQGNDFQLQVWHELLQIQPGTLVSHGQRATVLGRPDAAHAVGAAAGRNPLAFLIPCHRVIRETGVVGDYRWGRDRKRTIMARESSNRCSRVKTRSTGSEGCGLDDRSMHPPFRSATEYLRGKRQNIAAAWAGSLIPCHQALQRFLEFSPSEYTIG